MTKNDIFTLPRSWRGAPCRLNHRIVSKLTIITPMARNKSSRQGGRRRPPKDARGGPYWLYGRHPVMAALANPARVHRRILAVSETAPSVQQYGPEIVERDALADLLPEGNHDNRIRFAALNLRYDL